MWGRSSVRKVVSRPKFTEQNYINQWNKMTQTPPHFQVYQRKLQWNNKLFTVRQMIMSLCPWKDSAAFCISLIAVMFHRNMNIAELVNTNRLQYVIFLIMNFHGTKYPSLEKMRNGRLFWPWQRLPLTLY